METTVGVIVLVIIFGIIAYFAYQKYSKKPVDPGAGNPVPIPSTFKYQYDRADGGYLFSNYEIPAGLLDSVMSKVMEGLTNQVTAMPADWEKMKNTGDYWIMFIEPMATNLDGSPALLVGKDKVQAAGTCLNIGNTIVGRAGRPTIVVPWQTEWNFLDYLMRSCWHEAEHCSEWMNDYSVFWKYQYPNDNHPHRPLPQPLGLMRSESAEGQGSNTCGMRMSRTELETYGPYHVRVK